jgi:peptidoglycan/xylan/chitin deacetylase (PgdA/CDA1 family)
MNAKTMVILRFALALLLIHTGMAGPLEADESWDDSDWTMVEGGVIRGDVDRRELALIFTADTFGEGTVPILETLRLQQVRGSFFLTGAYLADPAHQSCVRRMVSEGHYVGPHSHGHQLLCPWDDRQRSLVSEQAFKSDLRRNLSGLRSTRARLTKPVYYIPPYEWYNCQHSQWARELGCVLFSFTPGSGSHRDWMRESHPQFRSSAVMLADILAWERQDPHGLNGHLLLFHLGSERQDKMYWCLDRLLKELHRRGYAFVTVDRLLTPR